MTKVCPAAVEIYDYYNKKIIGCPFKECPFANSTDTNKYKCPVKNPGVIP